MYKKFTAQPALLALLFLSGSLYSQSPGGIARQSLWLKGNFFADSTQTRTMNFNPATMLGVSSEGVKFPGTIDDLRRATIFTVFKNTDINQDNPVWQLSDGSGDLKFTTRQVSSNSQKTNMVYGDSLADFLQPGPQSLLSTYIRRERAQDDASANNKEVLIQFGQSTASAQPEKSQGLIAEFIVYETILKDKDIARIETYLALKYGITLQRNYINSGGETVWNRKEAKLYSNNIAGIGRDDQSALYQKQGTSSSSPDQLTIGVSQISPLNSTNTGVMNDRDYLIWGDNARSFRFDEQSKPTEGDVLLSEKKWLMESAGESVHAVSTQLNINTKSLLPAGVSGSNFYLVIDRSGTGDFKLRDCSYILPDLIADDGTASFSGVKWDTDRSGKDVFTFGVNRKLPDNALDGSGKMLSFQVYPNPITNGNYRVAVTLEKPAEVNMLIYDDHLRLVESRKMSGQSDYLFSGNLRAASGVYVIKLVANGKEYSKILVLQ